MTSCLGKNFGNTKSCPNIFSNDFITKKSTFIIYCTNYFCYKIFL